MAKIKKEGTSNKREVSRVSDCKQYIYIRYATARLGFSGRFLPEAEKQKCKQGV